MDDRQGVRELRRRRRQGNLRLVPSWTSEQEVVAAVFRKGHGPASGGVEQPQPISDKHGPRGHGAQPNVGVVLLGQEFQVIGVFSLPFRSAVLEPNLNLKT